MAGGQVGRLSVRVFPDTTQFRRDLKKALDRAEKAVKATINVELNVTKASLANVKRQLQGLEAKVPVIAELARESKQKVQDQLDGIDATATVNTDLDHGAASAKIAAFTRPRTLPINVAINPASLAKATAAIAALSGARVLSNFGRSIKNAVANLDQALPALAAGATAISNLSTAALAGTSNLLGIGAGLASIAPAALALPGIFAGFGVGLGVMVAALKDAGDHLGDLGPKFSAIQDKISTNFWGRAAQPIRDLANNALPMLSARLGEIGGELGGFFASMANSLNTPTNLGFINGILVSVRDSIDIASEGIANFTDGLLNLANAGATYLEPLASAFNRMSERFNAWVQTNTDNGQIFQWIDAGVVALQDLGRVLGATGGILAGFATAAANAGGANLGALADGLESVNKAVNGPAFQGALTTVFQGAHDAMAALGPGVAALGDAFVDFAPALAEILVLAGQVGSVGLTAIATAFQHPAFQGGLVDFFEGVLSGVEAIAPHIPALATAFGSVASFAGTLAAVLGPVLGTAISALAPVVAALMPALSSVAGVLGGVLVSAISAVAPFIQQIVTAISSWVQQNPGLAAGLAAAAVAVGGLIAGAVSLFTALAPIISAVVGIVSGLAGLGVTAGAVGSAIATIAPIVAAVVAALGAAVAIVGSLVAAFVYAWNTSAQFREAIAGLGQAIMGFLQPVVDFVTGTLVPVLQQIAGSFLGMMQQIGAALTPLMTVVVQIATQIYTLLTPLVAFLMSVLAPAFTFLGNVASTAFSVLGTVISGALTFITGILQGFLALLKGDWAGAWTAVSTTVSSALSGIRSIFVSVLAAIATFVSGWIGRIVAFFVNLGARARATVAAGMNAVRGVFSSVLSAAASIVSSVLSRIVGYFSSKIASARSAVTSGMNAVRSVFSSVLAAVASVVSSKLAAVVSFFSSKIAAARSTVSSGLASIRSTFSSILAAVVSAVASKASEVVAKFRSIGTRGVAAVRSFISQFTSVGRNIVQGIINGVSGMGGKLFGKLKGLATGALKSAKSVLGIHSPSREFKKIGQYTVDGLVLGLQGNASAAAKASDQLARGVIDTFQKRAAGAKSTKVNALSDQLTRLRSQAKSLSKQAKATRKVVDVVGKTKGRKNAKGQWTVKPKDVTKTRKVATTAAKAAASQLKSVQRQISSTQTALSKARRGDTKGSATAQAKAFFEKNLAASTARLEQLAKQRDAVAKKLKAAQAKLEDAIKVRDDYKSSVGKSLAGTFEITAGSATQSVKSIIAGFKDAATTVATFGKQLASLRKMGLPAGLVDQITQLGAEKGTAVAANLLTASKGQIKSLASSYKKLNSVSDSTASQLADGMYGAGVQGAQGLVNGLKSQQKALERTSADLAKIVVNTTKQKLKIHSPSRVMTQLGQYTGAGMVKGLESSAASVNRSMLALVTPPSAASFGLSGGGVSRTESYSPTVNVNVGETTDGTRIGRRAAEALDLARLAAAAS